jgi:hypothetical protein
MYLSFAGTVDGCDNDVNRPADNSRSVPYS